VRVARQIGEHSPGPGERALGVDEPALLAGLGKIPLNKLLEISH
jgi:hypothetical protein